MQDNRGGLGTRRPVGSWPISRYLLVLTLATSLPVAACAAFLAYHFVAESSQLTKADYEDRVRLMRNATELRIANIIEDLQVLALSPSLSDGQLAKFRDHAIEAGRLIGGVAIVLYAPDGQQIVNTRLQLDGPLPKRVDFDIERCVFVFGVPQVSGLQRAVVDGQPIVTIAVPVRIAGELRYALNIGLSTRYLSSLMDQYVSGGLVGSIIDSKGILLARRPLIGDDELVGQTTIPEVMAHIGDSSAFWIKATSRAGIPTYSSLLRSGQSGWTVNLAVPRDVIDGPLRRTVEWIIALTVFTFVLGLALARYVANRFLAEFASFEKYVVHLRANVDEPETGSIAEVNRMKKILHEVGRDLVGVLDLQKALLDEVNHRVKNTLATVQSIARMSRASSVDLEQYATAFEGRLLALSDAYNLLTENNWVGARLEAVAKRTLAPFAGPDRFDIGGPGVLRPPGRARAGAAGRRGRGAGAAGGGAFS